MTPSNIYSYEDLLAALKGGDEEMTSPVMILLQGISSSGKSTLARHLAKDMNLVHLEIEQFYTLDDGSTLFMPDLVQYAAWYTAARAAREMLLGTKRIVVSNTMTTSTAVKPFADLAATLGMEPPLIVRMGPRCRFPGTRIHSVATISRQIAALRSTRSTVPHLIVQCPLFDSEFASN